MAAACALSGSALAGQLGGSIAAMRSGLPEARRLAHRRHAAAGRCRPPLRSSTVASAGPRQSGSAYTQQQQQQQQLEAARDIDDDIVGWNWAGSDEFTPMGDRRDAPPLPLPHLAHSQRVVLVRHGQSTWNARNRIQGSSNFSVLTELGVEQAQAARKLLAGWDFTSMFVSPLKRAVQTSEIVWGGRKAPVVQLPSLREIDLYSFQGLDKIENRNMYPEQYAAWQGNPAQFEIDGHAPVRELWYRASLAWGKVLRAAGGSSKRQQQKSGGCSLLVAHNAVNQALLCTALGLPPTFFRRFSQSNAAFSVVDFDAGGSGEWEAGSSAAPPRVRVERVNQFPDRPMTPGRLGRSSPNRLVLVCGSITSPAVQGSLAMLASVGVTTPALIGVGSTAQQALDIRTAVQAALSTPGDGRAVLAVASPGTCQQLLGECLGPADPSAPPQQQAASVAAVGAMFGMSEGGVTIVNWPQGQRELGRGTILCVNYQLPPAGATDGAEGTAALASGTGSGAGEGA